MNKFLTAIAVALIATSCVAIPTDEIGIGGEGFGPTSSLTISLEDTRTYLGEKAGDSYPVYWSAKDKISMNGLISTEAVIDKDNPAIATFEFRGELQEGCMITYPATTAGKIVFVAEQTHFDNTSFGAGVATMYGKTTDVGARLKHLTGALKIGLVGSATLSKIEISTTDDTPIAGTFKLNFTSGVWSTPSNDAVNTITYSFGKTGVALNPSTPTYAHIAIPAGEYSSLRVRIYDSEGRIMTREINASGDNAIKAGVVREFGKAVTFEADSASKVAIGRMLPLWEEGYLDIHCINSGRGECTFLILPDGTTLIVDVGEIPPTMGDFPVSQLPSTDIRPTTTYARYIKTYLPTGKSWIDYCHISHFHNDHFGDPGIDAETNPIGYRKIGPMALYDEVPFKYIIDRAYPDYVEDSKTPAIDHTWLIDDWKALIKWGEENGKLQGMRFTAGKEQIKLLYKRDSYPNFRIFNIIANGYGYYLVDGVLKTKGSKSNSGNPASCGFHLSYGEFDYISCGDLTSASLNRMSYYYRDCMGCEGLDAFKANHHLSANGWTGQMRTNKFNPQVTVNHNFYKKQPDPVLMDSLLYTANMRNFFTTNAHPDALVESSQIYSDLDGYNGHIVVRVAPGGTSFYVYMLDASDFGYRVKSIHGPYTSK